MTRQRWRNVTWQAFEREGDYLPFGTTARLEGCPRVKDPFAKPFCFCTVCNSYLIEQREYLGKRELTTRGRDRGRDGG